MTLTNKTLILSAIMIGLTTSNAYADSSALTDGTNVQTTWYASCDPVCPTYHPTLIQSFFDCMNNPWCQERTIFATILGLIVIMMIAWALSFPIEYLIIKIKEKRHLSTLSQESKET